MQKRRGIEETGFGEQVPVQAQVGAESVPWTRRGGRKGVLFSE